MVNVADTDTLDVFEDIDYKISLNLFIFIWPVRVFNFLFGSVM